MAVENLLAKLTARGVGVPVGDLGTGGQPSPIDQAAVAAALAGLPGPAYWLARAKYLQDPEHTRAVWDHVAAMTHAIGDREGWGELSTEQARALALLALTPALWGVLCNGCEGRGVHNRRRGVVVTCPSCNGTGRGDIPLRRQAEMVGVPETTWRRVWLRRVDQLVRMVAAWEVAIEEHVRRKLRF